MVLKTRQALTALQADETALSVPVKKLIGQLEAVQGRLKQSFLDMYAEDYKADAADCGGRDGMILLKQLRDLQAQLEKAIPFAQAFSAPKVACSAL